jgi:hypothetical protein
MHCELLRGDVIRKLGARPRRAATAGCRTIMGSNCTPHPMPYPLPTNQLLVAALFCASCAAAFADSSGPVGIDRRLNYDNAAIWSASTLKSVEVASAVLVAGAAIYEGNHSRLGKTLWKSVDAMVVGDLAAAVGKVAFARQRPIDGNDPNAFFQGGGNTSFPSGETTHVTAIVTPFILEYQNDTPAIWLLGAIPAYVAAGKLKTQTHWQTDILAGVVLGASAGYWAHQRGAAWSARVLPGGFSVGYRKSF